MAGISITDASRAVPVGPPPPFDPELEPALAAMSSRGGMVLSLELIPAIRQAPSPFPVPTLEDLRARRRVRSVRSGSVPGPAGAPDISLLICRPACG